MIEVPTDAFEASPLGRFTTTGSVLVWCASPTLCGAYAWGRPDPAETKSVLRLFDQYPRMMSKTFDIVLDARAVEAVDEEALVAVTAWMWRHRAALLECIRVTSVIREGRAGFLLAGLLPTIANSGRFRVSTDVAEAFRGVLAEGADELAGEVESIAAHLRGVPACVQAVRALLEARLDATLEDAATALGMSPRSLQRALRSDGTSFHAEVAAARLAAASELLSSTDLKLAAIAAQVGLSERALTLLFQTRTGLSPIAWRRRQRP